MSMAPRSPIGAPPRWPRNSGVESPPAAEGGLAMDTRSLDHLGDEIAELSAHLDAATARLLELIREFDARGGWNTGFSSCAAWLSWRVGFDLGAARERVRVARPGDAAAAGPGPGAWRALVCQGPGPDSRGYAGDRGAALGGGARRHSGSCRTHRARLASGGPHSGGA